MQSLIVKVNIGIGMPKLSDDSALCQFPFDARQTGVGVMVLVGAGVAVGVKVGVGVRVGVGVNVGAGVSVGVGVNVGPKTCPGPQAVRKVRIKSRIMVKSRFLIFIGVMREPLLAMDAMCSSMRLRQIVIWYQ